MRACVRTLSALYRSMRFCVYGMRVRKGKRADNGGHSSDILRVPLLTCFCLLFCFSFVGIRNLRSWFLLDPRVRATRAISSLRFAASVNVGIPTVLGVSVCIL